METTRSSACMRWVVKTRLGWLWTTQVSLCFSSWIDSTYRWVSPLKSCSCYDQLKPQAVSPEHASPQMFSIPLSCRLLKPRPQFSSCAASAFTCPRTSWPAGVWETSRITSAHTCLTRASYSTQPHREKPFPSLLPKPSEANWCTHLHPFPFKRFELVLGSFLFLLLPTRSPLPDLKLIQFPSLFFFFFSSPSHSQCFFFFSLPFLDWFPHIYIFFLISPLLHSLLLTHLVLFIWTCTNIDFEWLVVLLEPHCQQHRSLKELFMLHQNRNKQYTGLHGGSQMDVFLYPCCHKKGLLKLVCNVKGVSRTTLHNLLTKGQVWIGVKTPV